MTPLRSKLRPLLLLISALLMIAAISGCGNSAPAESSSEPTERAVYRDPQKGYTTVLVMGLDQYERPEKPDGYINGMQADFFILIVLDDVNQTVQTLHINRDTMATITRLGVFGDAAGKYQGQLALAHTYGSGGSDSCLNATRAVSQFLGGVRIDHYITLTMDSVAVINDMVGGVEVELGDEFAEYGITFPPGTKITLTGEQALMFVRNRRNVGDQSNVSRMERQRAYMDLLAGKLIAAQAKDSQFASKLLRKLGNSVVTDYAIQAFSDMTKKAASYERKPIMTIDGEAVVGERFMEFYADEASVRNAVETLFDGKVAYNKK